MARFVLFRENCLFTIYCARFVGYSADLVEKWSYDTFIHMYAYEFASM